MRNNSKLRLALILSVVFLFGAFALAESTAWARAGGGRSTGSRGSRSFSAPSSPSSPSPSSPGFNSPGRSQSPSMPNQPSSGGFFGRSPFLQGMAGGLAGGMLGSLLFGGMGHAAPMGGLGGGGIGFLDILILGLLGYFAWKFFKKRRDQRAMATAYYGEGSQGQFDTYSGHPQDGSPYQAGYGQPDGASHTEPDELRRGIDQIRSYDPSFHEESFRETAQDLFFRVQAGWMNRDLDAIRSLLTNDMAEYFRDEFAHMRQRGVMNRLENIAVRKVELAEAWQETGQDYITVLITANLLDYTVDEASGQVVEGDKLNPVKFREFWTFRREIATKSWQLSAINQPDEAIARYN